MTVDPNTPMICSARQVAHQLRKVFSLPAHMTRFTFSADLESDIVQVEATFLFDETMLKDDTDASERTTTVPEAATKQGVADVATIAAPVATIRNLRKEAEARDGFQVCRYGSQ